MNVKGLRPSLPPKEWGLNPQPLQKGERSHLHRRLAWDTFTVYSKSPLVIPTPNDNLHSHAGRSWHIQLERKPSSLGCSSLRPTNFVDWWTSSHHPNVQYATASLVVPRNLFLRLMEGRSDASLHVAYPKILLLSGDLHFTKQLEPEPEPIWFWIPASFIKIKANGNIVCLDWDVHWPATTKIYNDVSEK